MRGYSGHASGGRTPLFTSKSLARRVTRRSVSARQILRFLPCQEAPMVQKKKPTNATSGAKPARAVAAENEKTSSGKSARPAAKEAAEPRRRDDEGEDGKNAKEAAGVAVRADVDRALIEEIRGEL